MALEQYENINYNKGIFNSYYNLSVTNFYFGKFEKSKKFIKMPQKFAYTIYEIGDVHKQMSYVFLREGRFLKAEKEILKSFELYYDMNASEQGVLETAAAELYFRSGNFNKLREILKRVKKNKNNNLKSWAFIQLKFLDLFIDGKILNRIPKAIDEDPFFNMQWHVLQLLQSGFYEQASELWKKLKSHNPNIFGDEFTIVVDDWELDEPFYRCIEKLLSIKQENVNSNLYEKLKEIKEDSYLQKLFINLLEAKIPLSKEVLVEKIWGRKYDKRLDNSFYQLISNLRENHQVDILMVNSTYSIVRLEVG